MDRGLRDRLPALIGNPFRDEGAAFRLVFVTIGVFSLVALGSWISTWAGLGVVAACIAAAGILAWRWRRARMLAPRATDRASLLLVGDPGAIDQGRVAALHPFGDVRIVEPGTDPVAAVEQALQAFAADEVVVFDPRSAERLRARFVVPVRLAAAADYLPETASR